MCHPYRRYCFFLAEKLKKSLFEIQELNSSEIAEWMAFDITKDEKWLENYDKQQELKRQREMSAEDKAKMMKQLLGGG